MVALLWRPWPLQRRVASALTAFPLVVGRRREAFFEVLSRRIGLGLHRQNLIQQLQLGVCGACKAVAASAIDEAASAAASGGC